MRKTIFVLALFAMSCGGALRLTGPMIHTFQTSADSYLAWKISGGAFYGPFYDSSKATLANLAPNLDSQGVRILFDIEEDIASLRENDSLNMHATNYAHYYTNAKAALDSKFKMIGAFQK